MCCDFFVFSVCRGSVTFLFFFITKKRNSDGDGTMALRGTILAFFGASFPARFDYFFPTYVVVSCAAFSPRLGFTPTSEWCVLHSVRLVLPDLVYNFDSKRKQPRCF